MKKAIIPAAGYGTRNLPITKVIPKEMFPIMGKPAIHYIVEEAVESGIEEILIIVSRNKNMIIDYFDRSLELEAFLTQVNKGHLIEKTASPDVHIQFIRQPYAKGLGDAIKLGKRFIGDEPFAILLPDDLFFDSKKPALSQLIDVYNRHHSNVLALQKVKNEHLKNYGVIKEEFISDSLYKVSDIVEKPKTNPPSNLAVNGRYILKPEIFTCLEKLRPGSGGELQLTDAIKQLLLDQTFYGSILTGAHFDIGKEEEYIELILKMNNLK
ncbi:UTP--glucose-1-phosphate uridylyltransferase [Pseudalkalibacillus caeni]|uniref:UTP--glucose-1-phosphate uridylyltransferase n=1 Tax=Exobacillus caeni TaxID=2574798 RepID=A0A5R9F207_9BACL|nr:UTP--glucose-1-phosphate uridylyltransferase [Pseudalkalibacillus caeni]